MQIGRRGLLGLGVAGAAGIASAGYVKAAPRPVSRFQPILAKALVDHAAPGIAVGVREADGKVETAVAGLANLETATNMSVVSVLRIGSLTKQFTAAAALKLAEQGKLDLDAPIAETLPAFNGKPAFSLREAIHHTAGLHSDEAGGALPDDGSLTQEKIAEAIAGQDTLFDFNPGTAWHYSNANYIVLGAAIEAAMHTPFDAAMERLLFQPLGLNHTAVDRQKDVVPGRVSGYGVSPDGDPGHWINQSIDVWQAGGAGAMRSTVSDLLRWHQMLIGGKVLGASALGAMLAPGTLRDGRVSGANRFAPEDANYGAVQYGGGLLISPPSERRTIMHYGFIAGFSALLETEFDRGRTLAVLLNGDPGPNLPFRALRNAVFG